jgi:16S rRNA (uracil1498-N3)-methyltransferase
MAKTKPAPRLFVEPGLGPETRLALDSSQAHYLVHVMRLKAGDGVVLFNGRDGEWSAVIETIGKNNCPVTTGKRLRPQETEPGPWLAFAPVKKSQTDFIVEKAAELGASRLCPVFTRNTNSTRINLDRMRANAVEASEQCRRLTVPAIDEPVTLERLMAGWPVDRRLLVLDETGAGQPIAKVLAGLRKGSDGIFHECGFLTGPEGGFDKAELDALRKLDFVTGVGLGPRVLRAETAAIAALSCWQALLGGDNYS